MLFVVLGTGVGTTLIAAEVIVPLERGQMPYRDATITDYLGKEGFEGDGEEEWAEAVVEVVNILKVAFVAEFDIHQDLGAEYNHGQSGTLVVHPGK
jgi:polyphosphate glucokinase